MNHMFSLDIARLVLRNLPDWTWPSLLSFDTIQDLHEFDDFFDSKNLFRQTIFKLACARGVMSVAVHCWTKELVEVNNGKILEIAARSEQLEIVRWLLQKTTFSQVCLNKALFCAVRNKDHWMARSLIEAGASPLIKDGRLMLMASTKNDLEMMRLLMRSANFSQQLDNIIKSQTNFILRGVKQADGLEQARIICDKKDGLHDDPRDAEMFHSRRKGVIRLYHAAIQGKRHDISDMIWVDVQMSNMYRLRMAFETVRSIFNDLNLSRFDEAAEACPNQDSVNLIRHYVFVGSFYNFFDLDNPGPLGDILQRWSDKDWFPKYVSQTIIEVACVVFRMRKVEILKYLFRDPTIRSAYTSSEKIKDIFSRCVCSGRERCEKGKCVHHAPYLDPMQQK